jgi:hypothetical protein
VDTQHPEEWQHFQKTSYSKEEYYLEKSLVSMLFDDRRYLKKRRLFDGRRQCLKRRLVMGIVLESLERS